MKKIIILTLIISNLSIAQTKIWFDTDIMIGMPDKTAREVDDAITLIMALKQPQLEIVGISHVTYVDYGFEMVKKILKWHHKGKEIPVYKGANTVDDFGKENAATKAIYNALKKEKLTILALGPVTNIATLVKNHPDIISQIDRIVMCAARTPNLIFNPGNGKLNVFDYNYEYDTKSMDILLATKIPLEFAGYEPSSSLHIGKIDLASLDLTLEADKWLHDIVQPWMQFNKDLFDVYGFIPFDCATLGIVSHPEYFSYYENIPVEVKFKKNDALKIQPNQKFKNFLEVSYHFKSKRKVKYARKTLQGFEEKILECLSAKNPISN